MAFISCLFPVFEFYPAKYVLFCSVEAGLSNCFGGGFLFAPSHYQY